MNKDEQTIYVERIEMPTGLWTRIATGKHVSCGAQFQQGLISPPPLKCIRLCKPQTPRQLGAANLSAGDSASRPSEWTHPRCGLLSIFFDRLSSTAVHPQWTYVSRLGKLAFLYSHFIPLSFASLCVTKIYNFIGHLGSHKTLNNYT